MLKNYKKILFSTSIVTIIPIIAGLILWKWLPEEIPTHFDASGLPNDYSSKAFAVIGLPLILLGLHLICFFGTMADPKRSGYSKSLYNIVLWICPAVSVLCAFLMYGTALGYEIKINFIMPIFLGLLFVLIGNYMPKCKRNYTMGIKLPWTLNSDENWNKTHRLAGFLWVIGGIIIILTAFVQIVWIWIPVLISASGIPTIYSFLYYKKFECK